MVILQKILLHDQWLHLNNLDRYNCYFWCKPSWKKWSPLLGFELGPTMSYVSWTTMLLKSLHNTTVRLFAVFCCNMSVSLLAAKKILHGHFFYKHKIRKFFVSMMANMIIFHASRYLPANNYWLIEFTALEIMLWPALKAICTFIHFPINPVGILISY